MVVIPDVDQEPFHIDTKIWILSSQNILKAFKVFFYVKFVVVGKSSDYHDKSCRFTIIYLKI